VTFVIVAIALKNATITVQIMGIALSRLAFFLFLFAPVCIVLAMRYCQFSFREFVEATSPSVLSGISCIVTVTTITASGMIRNLTPVAGLVLSAIPAIVISAAVLLLLDGRLRAEVVQLVNGKLRATPKASMD